MAGITEIRGRMRSIQQTLKITNAMYLISSAKVKKARSSCRNMCAGAAVFYPCIQEMPFMKKMIAKSTSGLWETILSSILRAVRCRWCRRASTPLQKG